jgi:ribose transport system ATP-binding protein
MIEPSLLRDPAAHTPMLQIDGLCKDYAVRVLDEASLTIHGGQIHALVGANGAGKSTLCKIIAGLTRPSEGSMRLDDQPFRPRHKADAERHGIQIVQQELTLIPTLSVAENLFFNRLPQRLGVLRTSLLRRKAAQACATFGLQHIDPSTPVSKLGIGQQQLLEIASALDRPCKLLILDEPTAMLSATESQQLFAWLDQRRKQGTAIIYISHRLREVKQWSDRISILRDGRVVGTFDTSALSIDAMVGHMSNQRRVASLHRGADVSQATRHDRVVMQVQSLRPRGRKAGIDFQLHRGEILGIAGLVGSGRTRLLQTLFGASPADTGTIRLFDAHGQPIAMPPRGRFSSPAQATRHGLAMVTEDRKQNGLLLPASIRVNTTLASITKLSRWGWWIGGRSERVATIDSIDTLEIRCQHAEQPVRTLSGGNQQKVAIAKWLRRDPMVYLFDEPTRGIDLAARERIYTLLRTLANQGKAILVASSDIEELMMICDRIGVMSAGKWVATYPRSQFDEPTITRASFAGYETHQTTAP